MESWQKKWAYNKYWIMAHSQQAYNDIRQLAKNNDWSTDKDQVFDKIITSTELIEPTKQTLTTAYQHVWGYFKKICTANEKETYLILLTKLTPENDELGSFLKLLTIKYNVTYLLNSRLINEL
ncbi:YbgA family protein [Lactiplantibacillus plantarum]|uniref:YbgA family protein n=1 Tax=Lactiplantibacillus plantarum TaxID=1590 RepID=UPI001BA4E2BF|nr:YbgA family protein [Lactiplantibacillus plantarum]MBS0951561.1 YbgA family protein [Lactiplantibacillus plantarum]